MRRRLGAAFAACLVLVGEAAAYGGEAFQALRGASSPEAAEAPPPPLGQGALGSLALAVEPQQAEPQNVSWCKPLPNLTASELVQLFQANCRRVNMSAQAINPIAKTQGGEVLTSWHERLAKAEDLCARGLIADAATAAQMGLSAWSDYIMQGKECCSILGPPYCLTTERGQGIHFIPFALCAFVLLLVGCSPQICRKSVSMPNLLVTECYTEMRTRVAAEVGVGAGPVDEAGPAALPGPPLPRDPERPPRVALQELQLLYKRGEGAGAPAGAVKRRPSSLGRLPNSNLWLDPAAQLFEVLQRRVGFQADSVKNQFEHFLTLWRSECSMKADESFELMRPDSETTVTVNQERLLQHGLTSLSAELLDGFKKYQARLRRLEAEGVPEGLQAPLATKPGVYYPPAIWPLGLRSDEVVRPDSMQPTKANFADLARIASFLLVWGESGNLRFMPEVVYFITDCLLSADLDQLDMTSGQTPFLTQVVRPLYNCIFEQWYKSVDVGGNKKDVKKLYPDLEKFMPADCPNYDDWNELFCSPTRLVQALVLEDGTTKLFSLPQSQRFASLSKIDWGKSLADCKTHREVHSLFGLFFAVHRVVFLHTIMFFVTLTLVAGGSAGLTVHRDYILLLGRSLQVRAAAVCLLVPLHAFAWTVSWWFTCGRGARRLWRQQYGPTCGPCLGRSLQTFGSLLFWCFPLGTYALVRYIEVLGPAEFQAKIDKVKPGFSQDLATSLVTGLHFFVSLLGACVILFAPGYLQFPPPVWRTTKVPCARTVLRWSFWVVLLGCKAWLSVLGVQALNNAMEDLHISRLGTEAVTMLPHYAFGTQWDKDVIQWIILMCTGYLLYISDTQFWFSLFCSLLGVFGAMEQRGFSAHHLKSLFFGRKLFELPSNLCRKVLHFTPNDDRTLAFIMLWDKVIEYWQYEDKLGPIMAGNLSFVGKASKHDWASVKQKLDLESHTAGRVTYPYIFQEISAMDRTIGRNLRLLPDSHWPVNPDVLWRLNAIARSLSMKMPRPFRSPYFPGLTVIIPHYGETILMVPKELYKRTGEAGSSVAAMASTASAADVVGHTRTLRGRMSKDVPLIAWLEHRYSDEFEAFTSRMMSIHKATWECRSGHQVTQHYDMCPQCVVDRRIANEKLELKKDPWPNCGTRWDKYQDSHWEHLCEWASMRSQTLWRTVAGMTQYHQALQIHHQLQADRSSALFKADMDISEIFTCMVSMQAYASFNETFLQHTNTMLERFEDSLAVAFIDFRDAEGDAGDFARRLLRDGVHRKQYRRYYSCLIDKYSAFEPAASLTPRAAAVHPSKDQRRRVPRYRVELPGFPILGDGKGDNQNHAIIFSRGTFVQCIDANQGAYFEQMLLLPNVLGEFRRPNREDGAYGSRKIVGFPEHITSDFGSIGDFAAGAETAFGTILQRSYSILGARMHYGHPDMMNKCFMIQQGGVSKATKTVNLSEDIFAGMDFTLRGDGRTIQHSEYFHLAKGRDLGFGTVLQFFSKLSAGTGEQLLTRQMARLGDQLGLPEFLAFYYAHGGFYLTQFLLSKSMPMLVYIWLLMSVDDAEDNADIMVADSRSVDGAVVLTRLLVSQFSTLLLLFLIAGTAPLVVEVWIQTGAIAAITRLVKMMATLAPLHFIFQAKLIGAYVSNEILYGGATYVSTGRGLPTERRPFIGKPGVQGLYQDYAPYALYDGMKLLISAGLVVGVRGLAVFAADGVVLVWWLIALGMTITSWLFAPFIFNPYQYDSGQWFADVRDWWRFFFFVPEASRGEEVERAGGDLLRCDWKAWYERTELKERSGIRASPCAVLTWIFFLASFWAIVNNRLHLLSSVLSVSGTAISSLALLPPVLFSFVFCATTCVCVERSGNFLFVSMLILMDVVEACAGLYFFWINGWTNTIVAGMLLKYAMLSGLLVIVENLYRMKDPPTCVWLKLWLLGHRMARDIIVSGFIFSVLSLGYMLDFARVNLCCCSYSPHNLLIYRDPGSQTNVHSEKIDMEGFRTRNMLDEDLGGSFVSGSLGGPPMGSLGGRGVQVSMARRQPQSEVEFRQQDLHRGGRRGSPPSSGARR